jgi:Tol biopolymer transport system component
VLLVPALGGPERKVGDVYTRGSVSIALPAPYLSKSTDGSSLVFSDRSSFPKDPFALFVLSTETGERRRLTSPPEKLLGDSGPAFSPDGRVLAFTRVVDAGISDLYLVVLSDGLKPLGEPRQVTFGNRRVTSPTWTADGREIVFANWVFGSRLWRVPASPSAGTPAEPRQLASLGADIHHPAIARNGRRLTYMHEFFHASIRSMPVPGTSMVGPRHQCLSVPDLFQP